MVLEDTPATFVAASCGKFAAKTSIKQSNEGPPWLARHGDRARRCHAELLRGAPTEAWGRCCCKVVARIGPEKDWEVTYRNTSKACEAASLLGPWVRRYRLFKKSLRKRTDDRSRFDHKHDEDESLDDDFGEDDDYGAITTNRSYQRRCFLSDGSFAFRDGRCRVKRYRLFKKSLRKRNLWPKMSSQEVAAYVAVAIAAAGAIVRVLRGRRGKKMDDKYP